MAVLALGLALAWGVLVSLTPHSLLARVLVWRDADVGDMWRFPARVVENAPPVFSFRRAPPGNPVKARVEGFEVGDEPFPAFLARTRTAALLVVRDGTLEYERYWGGYGHDSTVTSFSVAKSFLSALVGAAIAAGRIGSVDDPVTRYLPELGTRDPRLSRVTLRDLLTMSSGLRYASSPNPLADDDTRTYYAPDLRALALTVQVGEAPGRFEYNNYHPLLLGLVLERVTGQPVAAYLSEKLWQPLGMEAPGSWSLDSRGSGFEKLESGLNARAIDFAKFGQLYLDGGRWGGRQLLPREWVEASTRPQVTTGQADGPAYGYFWWVTPQPGGGRHFSARGNKGQFLYVVPEARLLMVRFGEEYGTREWPEVFERLAAHLRAAETR